MGNSETVVRFPSAKCSTPFGENTVVSSMSMTMAVDMCPTVEFVIHPKKDARLEAIKMSNKEVALSVGLAQDAIFSARIKPDTKVTVLDGQEGSEHELVFTGYYSNPSYMYGYGSAGMRQTAIHESAALDALVFDIYSLPNNNSFKVNGDPIEADNIAERIRLIKDRIIDTWEKHKASLIEIPAESEIKEKIHSVNLELMPLFEQILFNSETYMGWEYINKLQDGQKEIINNCIWETLLQQSGSFFSTILSLGKMFQSVWIPMMNSGNIGMLVNRSSLFKNVKTLNVTPSAVQFSGGASSLLPITHCVVQTPIAGWHKNTVEGWSSVPSPMSAVWPNAPYAGGRIIRDPGPPWLSPVSIPFEFWKPDDNGLTTSAYNKARDEAIGKTTDMDKIGFQLATQWARDIYNWNALSGAASSVEIPMDLSLRPGSYVSVQTKDGELFKGLITSVRHDLVAGDGGTGGMASTSLSFTNVEAGSFGLPHR